MKTIVRDNTVRTDSDLEKYADLSPVFDKEHGTITAGNSSPLTDGASALVMMAEEKAKALGLPTKGYIRSYAFTAVDPGDQLLIGPAYATPLALERAGMTLGRYGIWLTSMRHLLHRCYLWLKPSSQKHLPAKISTAMKRLVKWIGIHSTSMVVRLLLVIPFAGNRCTTNQSDIKRTSSARQALRFMWCVCSRWISQVQSYWRQYNDESSHTRKAVTITLLLSGLICRMKVVNTLKRSLFDEFESILADIQTDTTIEAVVIASDKEDFCVGADVNMLAEVDSATQGTKLSHQAQVMMQRIDDFALPIVAAIHGSCLGGGFRISSSLP